jgi:hypothetical protein
MEGGGGGVLLKRALHTHLQTTTERSWGRGASRAIPSSSRR